MRRLVVVQVLPALESGGVERSTLEIADALVRAGHRSIVVSAGGRLVPALEAGGSEHVALPVGRKQPVVAWRAMRALRRLVVARQPDLVHARSRLPAWVARGALRGLPRPPRFVTTVHGLNSPGRYSGVMASGERVICVSDTVRAHVLAHWPRTDPSRLVVIPRGVDPSQFAPGQPPRGWRDRIAADHPALRGGRWLLMPGRGTRLKGHDAAVGLLAALRSAGEDVRLWLLGADEDGRGHYLDELRAQAAALGVADAVAITPPRADIRDAYAASDLVLQLSNKPEAFGRTVVEALSVGRPVAGWDHGGVGELLRSLYPDGAVPTGDTDALQATARRLLAAPAPMPVTIPHTLAAMQAATLELYERLVAD